MRRRATGGVIVDPRRYIYIYREREMAVAPVSNCSCAPLSFQVERAGGRGAERTSLLLYKQGVHFSTRSFRARLDVPELEDRNEVSGDGCAYFLLLKN